jgi:hypothetical protein
MAQIGASLRKADPTADDVVAALVPHVGDRLIVVLPHLGHDYVRIIYGDCEARVRREKPGYLYEIVSRNLVLARGEKGSAYTALERSTSLLMMLKEASGVRWRAA